MEEFEKNENIGIVKISDEVVSVIAGIAAQEIDGIMDAADGRLQMFQEAIEGWGKALDREIEWSDKVGFFSDAYNLSRQLGKAE